MPEIHFHIQWPDGSVETCYSPSLVVQKYFTPDTVYPLPDFIARARTALGIASDRVQAKFGFPCSRALGQLERLEAKASIYLAQAPDSQVHFVKFSPL